jgi:hypothetical protein
MDPNWTFDGLPLHPLLVHATVILVPLTALALLLAVFWPAARRRLGFVVPLAGLLMVVLVPITQAAGLALKEVVGPIPAVLVHEGYGLMLLPWTIAVAVVAVGEWVWYRFFNDRMKVSRPGVARVIQIAIAVAAVIVAAGSLVVVFLAGEAGTRAVWQGLFPN